MSEKTPVKLFSSFTVMAPSQLPVLGVLSFFCSSCSITEQQWRSVLSGSCAVTSVRQLVVRRAVRSIWPTLLHVSKCLFVFCWDYSVRLQADIRFDFMWCFQWNSSHYVSDSWKKWTGQSSSPTILQTKSEERILWGVDFSSSSNQHRLISARLTVEQTLPMCSFATER